MKEIAYLMQSEISGFFSFSLDACRITMVTRYIYHETLKEGIFSFIIFYLNDMYDLNKFCFICHILVL